MGISSKIYFLIIGIIISSPILEGQVTENDIREILILQGVTDHLESQTIELYNKFLDRTSYKFNDFTQGALYSCLSGISMGACESNVYDYKNYQWLPSGLQNWYGNRSKILEADYHFLSWQMFFRETDYIADKAGYDTFLRYFRNQWYYALICHWTIKNVFATIIRDQFKHEKPFYSFQFSLVF